MGPLERLLSRRSFAPSQSGVVSDRIKRNGKNDVRVVIIMLLVKNFDLEKVDDNDPRRCKRWGGRGVIVSTAINSSAEARGARALADDPSFRLHH